MISEELRARIDADMARVPGMSFVESLAFLAGYSSRFDEEVRRGEATRAVLRAYADASLAQARRDHDAAAALSPVCQWFVKCVRPAAGVALDADYRRVPVCQVCADALGLTVIERCQGECVNAHERCDECWQGS